MSISTESVSAELESALSYLKMGHRDLFRDNLITLVGSLKPHVAWVRENEKIYDEILNALFMEVFPNETSDSIQHIISGLPDSKSRKLEKIIEYYISLGWIELLNILKNIHSSWVSHDEIVAAMALKNASDSKKYDAIQKMIPIPPTGYLTRTATVAMEKQEKHQAEFIKYHQEQVTFSLNFINAIVATKDVELVKKMMGGLALHRKRFAFSRENKAGASSFGSIRNGDEETQIKGVYGPYAEQFELTPEETAHGRKIFYKDILLTILTKTCWSHCFEEGRDFLLNEFYHRYLELCLKSYSNPEEAQRDIGLFHWLGAHLMPWKRGSAAILDQMIDALWIYHFNWAPEKLPGVSLDCFALINNCMEKYARQYPKFPQLLPKGWELLNAAQKGDIATIRKLVATKIDIEVRDVSGLTPFLLAVGYGHVGIARELMSAGCNIQARCSKEKTALDYANKLSDPRMKLTMGLIIESDPRIRLAIYLDIGSTPLINQEEIEKGFLASYFDGMEKTLATTFRSIFRTESGENSTLLTFLNSIIASYAYDIGMAEKNYTDILSAYFPLDTGMGEKEEEGHLRLPKYRALLPAFRMAKERRKDTNELCVLVKEYVGFGSRRTI